MFAPDRSIVTTSGHLDLKYLRSRIRVHQLSEAGWENAEIAVALKLTAWQVRRYLELQKPFLPWPRSGWVEGAICKPEHSELFYPSSTGNHNRNCKEKAKKICAACPVIESCYQMAIDNCETFGVWGGQDMSQHVYVFDEATGNVIATVRGGGGAIQKVG